MVRSQIGPVWSGHKSVQFGPVSVFFPVLRLDFETLIIWGYNNIRIKEGHEERAAFLTPRGLLEPLVMYFGLTNSPGTFMRMMSTIFQDMIREKKCVIFMDDTIFIGKNKEELQKYTVGGLKILEKHDLYIKEKKCYWEVTEVPMLGHIVGNGQVRMEPNKVKVILDWEPPTCKKDIQKFNGFCNFYRRYITGYSNIARPITTLMGNKTFKWEKKEQDAFEELKQIVASEQVITLPIADGKYQVEADASGYAIGANPFTAPRGQMENRCPPLTESRSMSDAELRYDIYDKELLAIVSALKEWHPYLLDTAEPFKIWSDHKNLSYFRKPQRLNG